MRQRWNVLVSSVVAIGRTGSKEVEGYLPELYAEETPEPDFSISEELEERIHDAGYLVANKDFDKAVALAEQAFEARAMAAPLAYEHTLLLSPIESMIDQSQRTPAMAVAMCERFADWFEESPDSPYAAAFYAKALHNAGYAYRGTDVARAVTSEGWEKLEAYERQAIDVFRLSGEHGADHWFWRECYFDLAITDYRGRIDHQLRFDKAIELQPLSGPLWKKGAYQLLPRWHGNYQMLHEHCIKAHEATRAHTGRRLYNELIQMQHAYEGVGSGVIAATKLLAEIAEELSLSEEDADMTLAASYFHWVKDYERFLATMRRIRTLYADRWYIVDSPALAVAFSLEMVKRNSRTRTRAA